MGIGSRYALLTMTVRDAIEAAARVITRRDAETLLAHLLQRDRAWIVAHLEDEMAPEALEELRDLSRRRAAQQPLQHLTGKQEFFGLKFRVTRDVLIPRPETEHLVEAVLDWAHGQRDSTLHKARSLRIVDVGTGSGAIAVALATALDGVSVTAIDLSPAALAVARGNARGLGVGEKVGFVEGDLLEPVLGQGQPFDVVASNPPYVALDDRETLAPEVRDYEPALALFAGGDGLAIYRRLIPQAFEALRPSGLLALEIGYGQKDAIAEMLSLWREVRFVEDYAGIPRVALAIRP